jgi:hypothetical protein
MNDILATVHLICTAEIETKHTVCMKELSNKDLKIHSAEKRNQELGNRFKV